MPIFMTMSCEQVYKYHKKVLVLILQVYVIFTLYVLFTLYDWCYIYVVTYILSGASFIEDRDHPLYQTKNSRLSDKKSLNVPTQTTPPTIEYAIVNGVSTVHNPTPPFRKIGRPRLDDTSKYLIFIALYGIHHFF